MLRKIIVPAACVSAMLGISALAYIYIGGGFVDKPHKDAAPIAEPGKVDDTHKKADKNPAVELPAVKRGPTRGVFAIVKPGQEMPPQIVANPKIKGITLSLQWDQLNPAENKFDWKRFDMSLEHCKRFRKEVALEILAGCYTPKWVLDKGVKLFQFKNVYKYDESTKDQMVSMPLPWDEIYQTEWEKFLNELGRHCSNREEVVMAHMTGPTAFTSRMSLPAGKDDLPNWKKSDYSREKLIKAWEKTFDSYLKAFPDIVLCLTLDTPVIGDDNNILEDIVNLGAERLNGRLALQSANLQDSKMYEHFRPQPEFSLLAKNSGKLVIGLRQGVVGYESSPKPGLTLGNIKNAVEFGMQFSPAYFEIYIIDILKTADLLDFVNKQFNDSEKK
ncbi:MAG: beta-galactosidase [Planctomycetes bacterium]|nr:beta-galactosidase [Planctomycetota bacterium]